MTLTETEDPDWVRISDSSGKQIGFTNEGFLKAIDASCEVYAELPIEYGSARTNENTYVDAYSHLVDISKYLKVYYSTDIDNTGVDLSQYDVKVSMKLSTSDTTIGEPFYNRNLCMLQYDTLQKLMLAIEKFREDGYTIVITTHIVRQVSSNAGSTSYRYTNGSRIRQSAWAAYTTVEPLSICRSSTARATSLRCRLRCTPSPSNLRGQARQ